MEDNVGRHPLLARDLEPQRAQRLPQRLIARRRIGSDRAVGCRATTPRPPARRRLGIIAAKLHGNLAAQDRRRGLAQAQTAMAFDVDGQMALRRPAGGTPSAMALARSAPTPKVLSRSWPNCAMRSLTRPDQHVDEMADAEALPGAIDADSAFCAATVPSHTRSGFRQLSQLPQGG